MKFIKFFALTLTLCMIFASCSKADKEFGVESDVDEKIKNSVADSSLPEIMSLDSKMSKYSVL